MTIEEKLALLEETMEMDAGSLKADMDLCDVEEYDSMSKLSIIVMLEDEFGIEIPTDDLEQIVTVGDVINYINEHKE